MNQKSCDTVRMPFIDLLLKIMDAADMSSLINGMYKTAKGGLSFSIFQEIFDLAGIENAVYLLTFDQLLKIQPTPSIVYLKEQQCFAILDKVQANKITLLTHFDNSLTLDGEEFQKTWDGILLPIDEGSFTEISAAERTIRNYQLDENNELEIIVSPVESDSKSASIHLGRLNTSGFIHEDYFCFETIIPACKGIILTVLTKNKTGKADHVTCAYNIPVSFGQAINIIRFHFAKINHRGDFNIIGLRGSKNQIFKVDEK